MWDLTVSVPDYCLSFYLVGPVASTGIHAHSLLVWSILINVVLKIVGTKRSEMNRLSIYLTQERFLLTSSLGPTTSL